MINSKGFTLVQLMLIIFIIGLIVTITFQLLNKSGHYKKYQAICSDWHSDLFDHVSISKGIITYYNFNDENSEKEVSISPGEFCRVIFIEII